MSLILHPPPPLSPPSCLILTPSPPPAVLCHFSTPPPFHSLRHNGQKNLPSDNIGLPPPLLRPFFGKQRGSRERRGGIEKRKRAKTRVHPQFFRETLG